MQFHVYEHWKTEVVIIEVVIFFTKAEVIHLNIKLCHVK